MSVFLAPLFSGSSGNVILAGSEKTKILIDAGVSCKRIEEALSTITEGTDEIKGILITHEHTDHIAGIRVLSKKHRIPVFATQQTWEACSEKLEVSPRLTRVITKDDFYIDDLLIEPFGLPHDAADPVGYCVSSGARKVAVATDLGYFPRELEYKLRSCDLVLLEANHDLEMLINGSYPYVLKQRIKSRHGHLSNDAAGDAAVKLACAGVTSILLGHLSKENNSEQLAFRTVTETLISGGITPGKDLKLGLAFRDRVTGLFSVK
jgi:phosphoribosyl 1,2-cyclic phosphodiesterase